MTNYGWIEGFEERSKAPENGNEGEERRAKG
jgi:hypothetical protein